MVAIKRLAEVSLEEAARIWNESFSHYAIPLSMSVDSFTFRLGVKQLSPAWSLVAYVDDEPAGILLTSIREIFGQRIAWNGGTGVSPRFRGRGVGKTLLEETIRIYREQQVEVATLEVLTDNRNAISLYEQYGYKIVGEVGSYDLHAADWARPVQERSNEYQLACKEGHEAMGISFYNRHVPWEAMYQNITDSRLLIVFDKGEKIVGYSLYRRRQEAGGQETLFLHQCETAPGVQDPETITMIMLQQIFQSAHPHAILKAYDFCSSHGWTEQVLRKLKASSTRQRYVMNLTL